MNAIPPDAPRDSAEKVKDQHGQSYKLTSLVGEGGQGAVWATDQPGVLAKLTNLRGEAELSEWRGRIRAVMRQPLDGLSIARPRALIVDPKPGYVMDLMDGLQPLTFMTVEVLGAPEALPAYIRTGGLLRRLRILARLARSLADLHGRGLAYSDLSPANVFVSQSEEHAEVWLIDADNISSRTQTGLHTPDYGAPEVVRGEAGTDALTDGWSFAVLAYQLLVLGHPLKGDGILDGAPELEEAALRGERPWVDDPHDRGNALSRGLPREITLSRELRGLFEECFGAGMGDPGARPSLNAWAEAFEAACAICAPCEGCGGSFLHLCACPSCGEEWGGEFASLTELRPFCSACACAFLPGEAQICPFCDHEHPSGRRLLLREFRQTPLQELRTAEGEHPEELLRELRWTPTGKALVLGGEPAAVRRSAPGCSFHAEESALCRLHLKPDGLWFSPAEGARVALESEEDGKRLEISYERRLKSGSRSGRIFSLHLAEGEQESFVWRFRW
ncbi:protein kinase domain-containing protein [Neomegalonema perideroedes]|uniref:protein kinase domain-containing protein n=1 Tax=Neomegalonema perideroedes TaxID=217219 RepID=UPI00037B5464|nr:lipopolysaccharide kinase InaA family protein [Neomegalonema perideroedes]